MGFWWRMGAGTSWIGFVRSFNTPFFGLISFFFAAVTFPAKSPDKRSPCDAALIVEDATRRDAVVQSGGMQSFLAQWGDPIRGTVFQCSIYNGIMLV